MQFGTLGRNQIYGPGRVNTNLALYKSFRLWSESSKFELRAEAFNAFNHTQFQNVDSTFTSATFGQVTSTWDPRVFQIGEIFQF